MIGIAELERPLRHAVEAQQQPLRLEVERAELPLQVGAQRVDVERIVVIRRQRAQRRLPAHPRQRGEHRIVRRRRRRRAILRIERRGEDARAAFARPCCSIAAAMPGIAVAHRIMDADVRQPLAQRLRLALRDHAQAASLRWSRSGYRPRPICCGRVRRMIPCRIGFHAIGGISMTRGSLRNSAR